MRPLIIKQEALKLRLKGYSYGEIKCMLGIPKSTLATWFSGLILSEKTWNKILKKGREKSIKILIERNKRQTPLAIKKALSIRRKAQQEINKLSKHDLLILGASLYWAEGYKRPIIKNGKEKTFHYVGFCNSDPYLIQLFLRFIREICKVPEERIKIQIMGYEHQNPKHLKNYWKKITNLKEKNFNKIYFGISKSSLGKRPFNRLQFGTIQVRIGNTELYNRIMGWIEGIKKYSI
ncbi:MAG: hypothetical protein Q7J06_00745 [Bacteroidales bacterium]|nr:hypothetical protein [Bacteroidales bacterium]